MNEAKDFPYWIDIEVKQPNDVVYRYTHRGLQNARGMNGESKQVLSFRVEVQRTADHVIFDWLRLPDDTSEDTKSFLKADALKRFQHLNNWIERVAHLVNDVEQWVKELGWSTRRIVKKLDDADIGKHELPALLMQEDACRLMMEPVGRSSPGTEGIVELYLMPRYDDIASFFYYDQRWNLHYPMPTGTDIASVREATAHEVSKEVMQQVLDEIKAHAV
jgi:hypothetical protein